MLRLAFDFIITWRETRTRPNAYKLKVLLVLCALLLLSAFIAERKAPITIFMIGDSTMANKSLKNGNIERGWGQMLPGYFTEEVVVDNHAMNG